MGDSVVNPYGFLDVLGLIASFLGIIVVLVITYFGSRWVAGKMAQSTSGSRIKILDRAMLGQDKYLAVARIGEKCFLIGVTPQNVSMLTEVNSEDFKDLPPPLPSTPTFGEMLSKAQKMGFGSKSRSNKDDGDC